MSVSSVKLSYVHATHGKQIESSTSNTHKRLVCTCPHCASMVLPICRIAYNIVWGEESLSQFTIAVKITGECGRIAYASEVYHSVVSWTETDLAVQTVGCYAVV